MRSSAMILILLFASASLGQAADPRDSNQGGPGSPQASDAAFPNARGPKCVRVGEEGSAFAPLIPSAPALTCSLSCPWFGEPEGEPPCHDGYVDLYNSGCNASVFQSLATCVFCGKSGTFINNGYQYRDTDWFEITGTGDTVTLTCTAEFPVSIYLFPETDCWSEYEHASGDACQETGLSRMIPNMQQAWVVIAPSSYTGVPCQSDYLLGLHGALYQPGTGGACCLPDGSCQHSDIYHCTDHLFGVWLGTCVSCDPDPCLPPSDILPPGDAATWGSVKKRFR